MDLGVGVVLPATVVLDREGGVAARFAGVVRRRDLEQVLDRLLAETHAGSAVPDAVAEHDHGAGHVLVAQGGPEASLVPS